MADASPVPLEDLAGLPEFYHPIVSPDGTQVAFYYDETGRNELYLLDLETGDYRQISDGNVPRNAQWYPRWDANGKRIYFHQDEDGDEQNDIYALDLAVDDPDHDRDGAVTEVVAPDGQAIIHDSTPEYLLYGSDEDQQLNLYRYDLASGESQALTAFDQPADGAIVAPDGDRVAFAANESDQLENRDVYVMSIDGSDTHRLAVGEDGSKTRLGDWFPDGDRLLVSDNATDLRRVGIYDTTSESTRWLGSNDYEEGAVAVAPNGKHVLAFRHRRAATMPVLYDVDTGDARELDVPEGVVALGEGHSTAGVFAGDSTLVFSHSTSATRSQLYRYDLNADESEVLLAAEYRDVDPNIFVDSRYVRYESDDGLEIGGLLYDPREGSVRPASDTDVPGVVMVHGGPHFHASRRFSLYVQFLVSRGYAVFQPNYRGSTGRGREFEHAIHGDWGGLEQADVAAGGRWLMDREWVDEDRVAVFGGSYGGYSVYCQLTQYPTHWTTGIAWMGITDLHRLHEDDMPHFQHQLESQMGDPEENYDLWRDRSPIEHVDHVERPLFMIHGVNDPRCPVIQARMFRDALEDRGWTEGEDADFEYVEVSEEGHGSTDIDQKIRVFRLLEDYLQRRL